MQITVGKKREKFHFHLFFEKGEAKGDLAQVFKKLKKNKRFQGKTSELEVLSASWPGGDQELAVGCGEGNLEDLRCAGGTVVRYARSKREDAVSVSATEELKPEEWAALAEGLVLGNYQYAKRPELEKGVGRVSLLDGAKRAVELIGKAKTLCEAQIFARDIGNEPANTCTPKYLVRRAEQIAAKSSKMKLRVLDRAEMRKRGFRALLGVSAGSVQPPYFILLEYRGAKGAPYAFVGKGITFDSGGISIKPSQKMDEMKFDMCGAAAVLGLGEALVRAPLPVHVVLAAPCTENLPSGSAQKPGDIVKSFSGKTIEILNTDAEGRLILADALSFVEKEYAPRAITDLATLTGACVVALGHHAAGLLGSDEKLLSSLHQAGEETGERSVRLPLWPEYLEEVKSEVAEVKNISSRGGGAITAAAFLKNFVQKTPWAHFDIAGVAWDVKGKSYIPSGATGFGVRTLYRFLENAL